jgi:hypothetical protein
MTGKSQVTKVIATKTYAAISVLGTVIGVVSDLLEPIAPFASWVLATSIVCAIILGIASFLVTKWKQELRVALVLSGSLFVVSGWLVYEQGKVQSQRGIIAEKFDAIQVVQSKLLGLENTIEEVNKGVNQANEKLDNLASVVKKEVSDDPRKELANMGLNWDEYAFRQSIIKGDISAIDLYLKAKMPLEFNASYIGGDFLFDDKGNLAQVYDKNLLHASPFSRLSHENKQLAEKVLKVFAKHNGDKSQLDHALYVNGLLANTETVNWLISLGAQNPQAHSTLRTIVNRLEQSPSDYMSDKINKCAEPKISEFKKTSEYATSVSNLKGLYSDKPAYLNERLDGLFDLILSQCKYNVQISEEYMFLKKYGSFLNEYKATLALFEK